MKHELKCWPEFFQASWVGDKTFEIRRNDRGFKERDEIVLREWEPSKDDNNTDPNYNGYSGREIEGFIDYITNFEQKDGFVVFSYRVTGKQE